jgi:hypothetical protein
MLQRSSPPVVILPDDDGADGGYVGDYFDNVPEEIAKALPDLIAAMGCPDTPAYREAVEEWCCVVTARFYVRSLRGYFAYGDSLEVGLWEYPARALRASKLAAELGPLLESLADSEFDRFKWPIREGAIQELGGTLVELAPLLLKEAEDVRLERRSQYPEKKFYREARSVWSQLGGTGSYYAFVLRLAAIAGLKGVSKQRVYWALNGRKTPGECTSVRRTVAVRGRVSGLTRGQKSARRKAHPKPRD